MTRENSVVKRTKTTTNLNNNLDNNNKYNISIIPRKDADKETVLTDESNKDSLNTIRTNTTKLNLKNSNLLLNDRDINLTKDDKSDNNEISNFLVINTKEMKYENEIRRVNKIVEEENLYKKRASNSSNSGKHLSLYYRTPNNKENKKVEYENNDLLLSSDSCSSFNSTNDNQIKKQI